LQIKSGVLCEVALRSCLVESGKAINLRSGVWVRDNPGVSVCTRPTRRPPAKVGDSHSDGDVLCERARLGVLNASSPDEQPLVRSASTPTER
jgi:hypothetical protein